MSDFYVGPGHLNLGHQACSAAILLEALISSGPRFISKHCTSSNCDKLEAFVYRISKKGLICKTSKELRQLNSQNQNLQQMRLQNPSAITQMANKIPIMHLK